MVADDSLFIKVINYKDNEHDFIIKVQPENTEDS